MNKPVELRPEQPTPLWHRRVLASFTLIMMGVSWPLWWHSASVPHFPAVSGLEHLQAETLLTPICVVGLILALTRRFGRVGTAITAVSGLMLMVLDQQRIQAWFYQTVVLSIVYTLVPESIAIGFVRFFAVTLYTHSALSKFDISFAQTMGPYLVSPITSRLAHPPQPSTLHWLVLAMPVGELIAAFLLVLGRFRTGCLALLFMHFFLMMLLGPWSLDHSANVLLWNTSMACQAIVLFGLFKRPAIAPEPQSEHVHQTGSPIALGVVQLMMMGVAILPFFERAGLWDAWPSFALYAGHVEQLRIEFPVADGTGIPAEFQPFITGKSGAYVLDLTAWSRHTIGSPPYPAARIHRRLAQYIARRCPSDLPMTAILLGKADWRTGHRSERIISGQSEIIKLH